MGGISENRTVAGIPVGSTGFDYEVNSMKGLFITTHKDFNLVFQALKNKESLTKKIFWEDCLDISSLGIGEMVAYDVIVVAVKDEEQSADICKILSRISGRGSNIINFFLFVHLTVPAMIADRVMCNPAVSEYEGMILGISHAYVGILPGCFDIPFCNLAFNSQDIFYNLKVFDYCITHYLSKVRSLKYLIIDLYDYTYFNYDTSMSRSVLGYYGCGGYTLEPHHFIENSHAHCDFETLQTMLLKRRYQDITEEQVDLFETMFYHVHETQGYLAYQSPCNIHLRNKIVSDTEVEEYQVETSIVRNVFEKIIQENITLFYQLLDRIYQFNPEMKVYLVLLPQYYQAQEKAKEAYAEWKERFYDIILTANQQYPFTFWDFKEHEIAKEQICFQDISHLNYYGANKFTNILRSMIMQDISEQKKISIIIPCYNVEKQIDRCITSLVGQTIGIENLELIFVDDASTDQTMEILAEWEQKYPDHILVIHCDENGRQGTARNIGLSYASGEFVGFVDADDWIEADMYETLYHMVQQYGCEVSGVLYQREDTAGNVYPIRSGQNQIYNKPVTIETEEERKKLLQRGIPGGICTKLFRADFIREHHLFFPEKLAYEDNFFGCMLRFCIHSYVICDQVMYHYMVNQDSTTMQGGTRHFDRLKIEMMKVEELHKRGFFQQFHDEIEFSFIKMYFCNSLALFFTKLPETPYDMIHLMVHTVKSWFPHFRDNPYLDRLNNTEKTFLEIIYQELGKEEIEKIADWYRQAVIEYFSKEEQ